MKFRVYRRNRWLRFELWSYGAAYRCFFDIVINDVWSSPRPWSQMSWP